LNSRGRGNEDGTASDQGNPVLLDYQLLGVGAGFNEDLILGRSCVDRVLNTLAGPNMYDVAVLVVTAVLIPDCRCQQLTRCDTDKGGRPWRLLGSPELIKGTAVTRPRERAPTTTKLSLMVAELSRTGSFVTGRLPSHGEQKAGADGSE
jgi:hypothetical protein